MSTDGDPLACGVDVDCLDAQPCHFGTNRQIFLEDAPGGSATVDSVATASVATTSVATTSAATESAATESPAIDPIAGELCELQDGEAIERTSMHEQRSFSSLPNENNSDSDLVNHPVVSGWPANPDQMRGK